MLNKLFSRKNKKNVASAEVEPLASSVSATIQSTLGIRSISPLPETAQKAFQVATNPKAELREFISVVEGDEALSARVLKIANSVYYERGKRSETVEEGITVIGLSELRSLLHATTLSELFPSSSNMRKVFWKHDVAVGIVARFLAERTLPSKKDEAFLAGLMHDVGKLLLVQKNRALVERAHRLMESSPKSTVEAEGEVAPFDHTEVGQLIGERWSFSPELLSCIRHHHRSWDFFEPVPTLPLITKCADLLVHTLNIGSPKEFAQYRQRCAEELPQGLEILGIRDLDPLFNSLKTLIERESAFYLEL